jgi:hypothetical protein
MDYSLFCCALKRALPKRQLICSRSLPTRALPPRAVRLISEYSKPLTHPNWKKSLPIVTIFRLYLTISPPTSELHYIILKNINQTEWYKMYYYIHQYRNTYFNEDFYRYD